MPQKISSLSEIPSVRQYLNAIGADARSLTTAVIRELHGKYYTDVAVIKLDPVTGVVVVTDPSTHKPLSKYEPTTEQAKAIRDEIGNFLFPKPKITQHYTLPPHLASSPDGTIFPFKQRDGSLVMIVQRVDKPNTDEKTYKPWTLFDDDEWRQCEPGDKLPLYGLDQLEGDTVFIHEGPKKAWWCNKLFRQAYTAEEIAERDAHPWKDWMMHGVHLGWHGGALSPYRTEWRELKIAGIKNVYIVPDNDAPGMRAVRKISPYLRDMNVFFVRWSKFFPASFDMAEPWPVDENFRQETHYVGPTFEELLRPATWATDKIAQEKGKAEIYLREHFAEQWRYIATTDLYINIRFPFMCYPEATFNKIVKEFSDHPKTSTMLHSFSVVHAERLVYRPDINIQQIHDVNAPAAINTYIAPLIKGIDGNTQPFEDFLDYMFVNKNERDIVKRWIATLISRPKVFIGWAHLWVSQMQGVGKNTIGEHILAPLIGHHNCSFPSEQMLVNSSFNSWLVRKRLIFISEIFAGHNFATYNKLKDYITGRTVEVNEKFVRSYSLQNWAHFIACSNTEKAMKIEARDRRWFCPELASTYWSKKDGNKAEHQENFRKLYHWLRCGGLQHIKHWADGFGEYYDGTDQEAPMTPRKQQIIEEGMTEEERVLTGWAEGFRENHSPIEMVICDRIIKQYLKNDHGLDVKFKTPLELRAILKQYGWFDPGYQMTIDGVSQHVLMSPQCVRVWKNDNTPKQSDVWRDWLRKRLRSMNDPENRGPQFVQQAKMMGV